MMNVTATAPPRPRPGHGHVPPKYRYPHYPRPMSSEMSKLTVRAFSISLDGMSADYGTEYFEWCMSGIDPSRVTI